MAIRAQLIQAGYDSRALFAASSFEVKENTVFVGKSGCGKSTLLKTLAGLRKPVSGSFTIDSSLSLGMIFQKNALFDSMTVLENVTYPLIKAKKMSASEAKRIAEFRLAQVGLDKIEHLYAHELSGGMQKRLGIARAVAMQPALLFVDEPTSGLDPITTDSICELLAEATRADSILLCVATNDVMVAKSLGKQFLFIDEKGVRPIGGSEIEHSF